MAYENFDEVIIQWVNCLGITTPIQDLDECKNGNFFQKFLSVLGDKSSLDRHTNTLGSIHKILEAVYKDFQFNKNKTHISELSRDEIIEISLLLMFYACVIEQNNTLITALCEKLPHKSQMVIKKFLENMTVKVNPAILNAIAHESLTVVSKDWSFQNSPLKIESPLQSYLTTPDGKRKLFEKDKEIRMLKIELETERFDKEDLQEEIKEHKVKIEVLEGKLKKSSETITKLRSELNNKEESGEKFNFNFVDIEKNYKSKIETLEKYGIQLELEQLELKNKNDDLIKMLKIANDELKTWQEKVLGMENENKDIREKHKLQEIEVDNLKSQCNELIICLDELRSSSHELDASVILSPAKVKRRSLNFSTIENLAGSVVEIQLDECRTENNQLKELLHEMTEKSKILDDELTSTKINYEKTFRECLEMKNKNEESIKKINDLIESQKTLSELLNLSRNKINELENIICDKNSVIFDLEKSLGKVNNLNNQLENEKSELNYQLIKINKEFQITLCEKDDIFKQITETSKIFQKQYEESVLNYNNLNSEFNALKKSYDDIINKFSNSLKKLSKITNKKIDESLENKFDFFDRLIQNIQEEKIENESKINKLMISLHNSEDVVNNLKTTEKILNDKFALTKIEKDQFEEMLKSSELHVKELENILELKTQETEKITFKISQLHKTINELNFIKSLQTDLKESTPEEIIDNTIKNVKKIDEEISFKIKENNSLNNKVNNLNQINNNLSKEILEKERSYLEKIFLLESEIKNYKESINQFETTIEITEQNLKAKQFEIEELQKGKITMEENYEKIKGDLEKKISLTKDTQKKLELEIQIISKEKSNLEINLSKFKNDIKNLETEKLKLIEENNLLKKQYSECFETLSKRDRELEDRDNIISTSNAELLSMKLELEMCKRKHKELQVEMDKIRQEESKYKFCIATLEEQNHEFETKLQQMTGEKEALKELKDNLEKKCQDLEKNLEMIITQLKEKNENLNDYCDQMSICKRESEVEVGNIRRALEETQDKLERVTVERNDAIQRYDEEISSLKSNLQEANNRIYELNSKEISQLQEIELLKSELNNSFQKYAENFNSQQELKLVHEAELQTITETLRDLGIECKRLEEENKTQNERLSDLLQEQEILKSEKIALEVKLVGQQKKYTQELENTREQFLSDINNLKNKEKKLENSLSKALSDLEDGKGIKIRLENEVKKITSKLNDVQQEKNRLEEKLRLLEETKKEVNLEYSQLKLTHEKYISESEYNLRELENKLETVIEKLEKENQKLLNEYFDLEKNIEILKENNKVVVEKYEQTINDLNKEIECLNEKIKNLEYLNEKISKEQEVLSKNTRKLKLEEDKFVEQNEVLSKLQCAYDILQTGKDRIEVDLQNVIEAKIKLEEEKIKNENLLEEKIKSFNNELEKLNKDLKNQNKIIENKDKELDKKINELEDLQKIYEIVSSEKEILKEQLKQSQELHKQFLCEIDEENLKTIGNMTFDFMELKGSYENVNCEIKKLKKEKKKLEKSLENVNHLKKELDHQYKEKLSIIEEVTKKSENFQDILLKERLKIQDILSELYSAINDLEWIKNEKYEMERQENKINSELKKLKDNQKVLIEIKSEFFNQKEDEVDQTHIQAEKLKINLLNTIKNIHKDYTSTKVQKNQLQEIINKEKESKTFLEVKLLDLMTQKIKYEQIINTFYININKISISLVQKPITNVISFENIPEDEIKILSEEIEKNVVEVYEKINEINKTVLNLQQEKTSIESKLIYLENEKIELNKEKNKLLNNYESLNKERGDFQKTIEKQKEEIDLNNFKFKEIENLKSENVILHQTVQSLKENNLRAYNDYQKFIETSKNYKNQIDKLLKDRNSTDTIITDLKQKLLNLQMKFIQLPQEFLFKQYFDQKDSLQLIVDDIQKQFNRYSRISFNIVYNFGSLSEKIIQALFSEKTVEVEAILKDLDIEETQIKIDELKDRAVDATEQIVNLEKVLENVEVKNNKVLKENVKNNQEKPDDEYRKKYISIKQKLTLVENVKNNYEKKLKQLREENKKLSLNKTPNDDVHYKTLLQQHVDTKDIYEKEISELKSKQIDLENELIKIKTEKDEMQFTQNEDYKKQFETLREKYSKIEQELLELQTEKLILHKTNKHEIETLREAYGKLMKDKSKLECDYESLKKSFDDRIYQLNEYALIKEAYQKLLEENNQIITEVDTLKFKRNKDKEEFVRLLKKEREEFASREETIRSQYDVKVEALKKKMITMYKEEVDKEMRKVLAKQADNSVLLSTLERYKLERDDVKKTNEELMKQINESTRKNELMLSRESLGARSVRSECDVREFRTREVIDCPRSGKRSSVHPVRTVVEARKCMTLPKNVEGNGQNRVVSPADIADKIEMEDEAECFHNKYLADLKDGRCEVPTGRESTSSRISQLAWRNSMQPAHLKSSYAVELQSVTPSRFKEEDIKSGAVDLDDSMNTKLLPTDKTQRKKEQGTTSYKKPGPPTPSKNGGRVSLQGSEIKDFALQESNNDGKTPKKSTPNKFKAFFLGRTSMGRTSSANIENQPPSPKNRQINKLFRKAR